MVVNGFFNHFIYSSFSDRVCCMPAAIMGLDVMESYVEIIRPAFSPITRSRRLGIFESVLNRLKHLNKLFIRSTAKRSSQSRGSIRETLGRW